MTDEAAVTLANVADLAETAGLAARDHQRLLVDQKQHVVVTPRAVVAYGRDVGGHRADERAFPLPQCLSVEVGGCEWYVVAEDSERHQEKLEGSRVGRVNPDSFPGRAVSVQKAQQILNQRAVEVLEKPSWSTEAGVVVEVEVLEVLEHQIVVRREDAAEGRRQQQVPKLLEIADFPESADLSRRQSLVAEKSEFVVHLSHHRLELVAVLPRGALNCVVADRVVKRATVVWAQKPVGVENRLDSHLLVSVESKNSVGEGTNGGLRALSVCVTEGEPIASVGGRQKCREGSLVALRNALHFVPSGHGQPLFALEGDVRVERPSVDQIEVGLAQIASAGVTGGDDIVHLRSDGLHPTDVVGAGKSGGVASVEPEL